MQARPITTLYPLPASAPGDPDDVRVYFSINVAPGVLGPFTPMARQAFRLLGSSVAGAFGVPPADPVSGPAALALAFRAGTLPTTLQAGLAQFLAQFGHRGAAGADLGVPRQL